MTHNNVFWSNIKGYLKIFTFEIVKFNYLIKSTHLLCCNFIGNQNALLEIEKNFYYCESYLVIIYTQYKV